MGRGHTAQTRQRLLQEGIRSLGDRGYHGTGLKEILNRAGVPKGSFYNYFESKEQFAAEVIRQFAQQSHERMDAWLSVDKDNALAALGGFFEAVAAHWQDEHGMGCLLGNLGAELGCSKGACRQAMLDGMDGMRQRFAAVLTRGQELGQVRTDVTAVELADLVLSAYEGALLRARIAGIAEPIRALSHSFVNSLVASPRA